MTATRTYADVQNDLTFWRSALAIPTAEEAFPAVTHYWKCKIAR